MSNIKKYLSILCSNMDYVAIVLGDCILLLFLFGAYAKGEGVHSFFAFMVLAIWFIFNWGCIVYIEVARSKDKNYPKYTMSKDSKIMKSLYFIIPKLKYLAIGLVDLFFINLIVEIYINNNFFSFPAFVTLLIYNFFCWFFIRKTRNMMMKEFYCFVIITCPVLILLAITIIE